jgi:hypothetical protein
LTLFDVSFFTGNGRPFAMEVCNPGVLFPTQDMLNSVCEYINSGQGINGAKDVELALLKAVSLCVVACNAMRCDAMRSDVIVHRLFRPRTLAVQFPCSMLLSSPLS